MPVVTGLCLFMSSLQTSMMTKFINLNPQIKKNVYIVALMLKQCSFTSILSIRVLDTVHSSLPCRP